MSALRDTAGKPRLDLVLRFHLDWLAAHMEAGTEKYPNDEDGTPNWTKGGRPDYEYTAAACRHLAKLVRGEEYDAELGTHHAAAVVFNMLALLTLNRTDAPRRQAVEPVIGDGSPEDEAFAAGLEALRARAQESIQALQGGLYTPEEARRAYGVAAARPIRRHRPRRDDVGVASTPSTAASADYPGVPLQGRVSEPLGWRELPAEQWESLAPGELVRVAWIGTGWADAEERTVGTCETSWDGRDDIVVELEMKLGDPWRWCLVRPSDGDRIQVRADRGRRA